MGVDQCFWTVQPWAVLIRYPFITLLIMDCSRAIPAQVIRKMSCYNLTLHFIIEGERVPSTPNSCSATNCGTRIISANAVLEAETAPTPNFLQNHLSTTPMDLVCDSHFPGTKSPLLISKLLPDLLKESIVPRSAKHGL